MGSIEAACISGFLCRLCSEMHRTVIHIYGDQGQKHELAKKINAYLPVTITPNDPLPKTICETCMTRVEQHHELMIKMEKHRTFFAAQSTRAQLIRSGEARNSTASSTNRTETITNRQTRTATPSVTVTSSSVTTTDTATNRISPNRNTVDGSNSTSTSTSTNDMDENEDEDESANTNETTDTCESGSNSDNNITNNNRRSATVEESL